MTHGGPAAILGTQRRAAAHQVRAGAGTVCEGDAMKQLRITKRHRPADWRLEPLPLDPRDPDIVRAKELARRSRTVVSRPSRARQAGS
jgi:Mg-chelatase subunit ChlI